jgi:hypothetical protein
MKKYLSLIVGAFFLLTIFEGCEKNLQEQPKTFISPDAFFNSADSYDQAVKGVYVSLAGLYAGNSMTMREMFSDICGSPAPSYEQALPIYLNNHEPFFYNVRDEWSNDYTIVKNANFVLSELGKSSILTATQKSSLTAEARFLRAFAYFQLVQFFGDVPLRTDPVENYSDIQIPRSSQDSVYNLILGDLNFAEANLPDVASQQGRVYKLVATALLAKVYLVRAGTPLNKTQEYQNARDKALAVINSGKFTLVNDYSGLFHNISYTSESIWEQTFDPGRGGNNLHGLCCTGAGYLTLLQPAQWFINSFPAGDQRKAWGVNQTYVDPNGNTLKPYFQKFVNNQFIADGLTPSASTLCNYTIPFLRLGEMYLIAAEAENEVNGPANAYQYINKIRWRARVDKSNPSNVPDLSGLSKTQFKTAVLMERKWELHLEGDTWFDLKRSNTLSNIQTIRGTDLVHPIGAYNQTWYIPDNEITNNNIPQNPAY